MKVTPGYIYVLKEKGAEFGPYKIGETADLGARLKSVFGQSLKVAEYCHTSYVPAQGRVDELVHNQLEAAYPNSRIYDRTTGKPTEWFNLSLEQIVPIVAKVSQGLRNRYSFEHNPSIDSSAQPDLIVDGKLKSAGNSDVFFSKSWKVGSAYYSLKQILAQAMHPANTVFSRWVQRHGIEFQQAFGKNVYFRFTPKQNSSLAQFANDELFRELPKSWVFSIKDH